MNILFIGDVVGSLGRGMVFEYVPKLKEKYRPHVTIINGENVAAGKGITENLPPFLEAGTSSNIGKPRGTIGNFDFIDDAKYMIRPANFPENTPGQGMVYLKVNSAEVAVINLQGRTFLPAIDCPFMKAEQLIREAKERTPFIFVDFHAEATSEKQAMGWFLDGKVSAVVGTHTHVQTADERILPGGTAYITDVGMTGLYDGIIGVDKDAVLRRFLTALPVRFDVPKKGRVQLSGVFIELDDHTGLAKRIERILINDDHPFH